MQPLSFYLRAFALLAALVAATTAGAEDVQVIRIPDAPSHTPADGNYYYEELLKLALEKTEAQYGKATTKFYPFIIGRERQRAILRSNTGLDVIWSSSNHLREEQLLAIKFNLQRDISDYKILLIRRADKKKFANINSLADLRNFKAGTGSHWQDTQVLQKNNIPFVTSWDYEPMFRMLAAKRFDYMIRGSQEIWGEIAQHPQFDFIAEERLLIHYHLPVYFFVNPQNNALADRIKAGLEAAEKDGSLDKLFFSIPGFKEAHDEAHSKRREVIDMESVD